MFHTNVSSKNKRKEDINDWRNCVQSSGTSSMNVSSAQAKQNEVILQI